MKIILDFDDTIFNTGYFNEEIVNIFKKLGFSVGEYNNNYQKSMDLKGDFDADLMIDLFSAKKNFDKKKTKIKINSLIKKSKRFVYKDFFDFAVSFHKKDLILVSVGLKEIQLGKIDNSGISTFVNKISIPEKYKSDEIGLIIKQYPIEKIFFVDDKAKQIDEAKKRFPQIVAIKMERPTGRHILPKSELVDHVVNNLSEVKKIINELSK